MPHDANPYDVNHLGKFTIVEQDNAFTVIHDKSKKSLHYQLYRSEITSWLLKTAEGKWTFSNPRSVSNPKSRDWTVVFENGADADAFRARFIDGVGEREWPVRYDFVAMKPVRDVA